MICSQRVRAARVIELKVSPPSTRAAMTTASTNPMIRGHLTVFNGFMRFPSICLCVGSRDRLGSCVAAGWKNRGVTPIIQRYGKVAKVLGLEGLLSYNWVNYVEIVDYGRD